MKMQLALVATGSTREADGVEQGEADADGS